MSCRRLPVGRGALAAVMLAVLTVLASGCASPSGSSPTTPAGTGSASTAPRPVTVFAAASLQAAFTEIAMLDLTLAVTFSFDGSPTLVDQVLAGAPADVLATADEATLARAVQGGAAASTPAIFASNTGVLIVPKGNPGQVTGLDQSLTGRRLVVCAPAVPCGATARAIANAAGVALRPVSEELKVSDVRGKVTSGEADAGIVFTTDARAAGEQVETVALPGAERFATRYPIVIVNDARHADAARAFVTLVTGPRGQEVLGRHGFTAP